jgi:hypothetical protein
MLLTALRVKSLPQVVTPSLYSDHVWRALRL